MAAPQTLDDADFDFDPEAPAGFKSVHAKQQFTVLFAVTVGIVFVLQMVLPQVLTIVLMPSMPSPFSGMQIEVPHAARAFRWRGEVWVPVEHVAPGQQPQTILKVMTPAGEWDTQRQITLTAPAEHFVPDGDVLWVVSANAVTRLQGGQPLTLFPRLRLSQPKSVFVYDGTVCVLDRNPDGTIRWLEYREGEWSKRAVFALPATATATLPPGAAAVTSRSESLQLIEHEGQHTLFYAGGNRLWSATPTLPTENSAETTTGDAASAASPSNVDSESLPLAWSDLGALTTTEVRVVSIEGRLAVIEKLPQQLQTRLSARWIDALATPAFAETMVTVVEEFGIAADHEAVSVVTDTFPPGGCRLIPLSAQGFGTATAGSTGGVFSMFGGSGMWELLKFQLIVTGITLGLTLALLVIASVLMSQYRDMRFAFGKHVVRLGSLWRRSIARVIDTMIVAVPTWILWGWALWNWGSRPMELVDAFLADWKRGLTILLLVVLGSLVYFLLVVVFLGALEGWYGWSPGKLLCGLRVCRTNFRKCGPLRGTVRQMALIVDGLFNYLVGMALIAFLPKCQRLGDLVMDTIVVEAATLPHESDLLKAG